MEAMRAELDRYKLYKAELAAVQGEMQKLIITNDITLPGDVSFLLFAARTADRDRALPYRCRWQCIHARAPPPPPPAAR